MNPNRFDGIRTHAHDNGCRMTNVHAWTNEKNSHGPLVVKIGTFGTKLAKFGIVVVTW